MKKKLLALIAPLVLVAGLIVGSASPAQAVGWSDPRCTNFSEGAICSWTHTVASGGGVRVTQVQICASQANSAGGDLFRGTKNSGITFVGSGGNVIGGAALNETGEPTVSGSCAVTYVSVQMGKGACAKVDGTRKYDYFADQGYHTQGNVIFGAC